MQGSLSKLRVLIQNSNITYMLIIILRLNESRIGITGQKKMPLRHKDTKAHKEKSINDIGFVQLGAFVPLWQKEALSSEPLFIIIINLKLAFSFKSKNCFQLIRTYSPGIRKINFSMNF